MLLAIHDNEEAIAKIAVTLDDFVTRFEELKPKIAKEKSNRPEFDDFNSYPSKEEFAGPITKLRECFANRESYNSRAEELGMEPAKRWDY